MTEAAAPKGPMPPYIAFKTLLDLVERMEREEPPTRVDPTYLDTYAGGYRPTVIGNLQTMGLLTKTGEPTPVLLGLVSSDDAGRKKMVGELVKGLYPEVFALGMNSTQGQFLEAFTARGATGDTRRKAISFFLKACAYAGVQTGTHWKTPAASATGSTRRRTPKTTDTADDTPPPFVPPPPPTDEHTRVVTLRTGGEISLSVNMNPLVLRGAERKFFNALVDLLDDYEAQTPQEAAPEVIAPTEPEV